MHFSQAEFARKVTFNYAMFHAYAGFNNARFGVNAVALFRVAIFTDKADFNEASFSSSADFSLAIFASYAAFSLATFSADADFSGTAFWAEANFRSATFKSYLRFAGDENRRAFIDQSSLDLQLARFEQADHVSFHTVILRPHWFVNVNGRKFDLTKVDWIWRTTKEEIKSLQAKNVAEPNRMLAIACRHLAVNAEESHNYVDASSFRLMAMDAGRLDHSGGFGFWRLSWWYWLASGYGERVLQAFVVLMGIMLVSALLYTQVGFTQWEPKLANAVDARSAERDEIGTPLRFKRALAYSASVMTLQRPEPRPATAQLSWLFCLRQF